MFDSEILQLLAFGTVILVLIILLSIYFFESKATKEGNQEPRAPVPVRAAAGLPRRAQLARNRGARLRANANVEHEQNNDAVEENEEKPESELSADGKLLGAKKRAKLEAKAEKKAAREAGEQLRAERKKKNDLEEAQRLKQKEKEDAEEKEREEAEKKVREEREKKEYDEYLKMKEAFQVEEEGFEDGEEGESQNLLQEFVDYIKQNKVVIIEDLAAHFKLKTQSCLDRIKDLQEDDILTGVIDDRGKFIYVSRSEMEAVAKFIRQRGRVSITELAESSNQLINLTPLSMVQSGN